MLLLHDFAYSVLSFRRTLSVALCNYAVLTSVCQEDVGTLMSTDLESPQNHCEYYRTCKKGIAGAVTGLGLTEKIAHNDLQLSAHSWFGSGYTFERQVSKASVMQVLEPKLVQTIGVSRLRCVEDHLACAIFPRSYFPTAC